MIRTPVLITAPADLPVSVKTLSDHLRLDGVAELDTLARLLDVAIEEVQARTWRQLVTATYEYSVDWFSDPIELPRPPLVSVEWVHYLDTGGAVQTLATSVYQVATNREPGIIRLAYGQTWPGTRAQDDAVTIRFKAGYGAAADVPARLRHAVLLLAAHYYETREAAAAGALAPIPYGLERLLDRAAEVA